MIIRPEDLRRQSDIVLNEREIALLRPFGVVRTTQVGDVLFDVGDAPYPLVVVLSGRTEIVDRSDGGEFVIKSSGPGEFDGELDLLTGQEAAASASSPFQTSHPGIFAVGDVRGGSVKRVASAVGEGSVVVQVVHGCLAEVGDGAQQHDDPRPAEPVVAAAAG